MNWFAVELSLVNFKETDENKRESKLITIALGSLSLIYMIFVLCFLHQLWYHYLVAIFSGIAFGYIMKEWYFELERKKLLKEAHEFMDAFARCYEGNNGNMIAAIGGAKDRGSERMRRFMNKLEQALKKENFEAECNLVREKAPLIFMKSFVELLVVLKQKGRSRDGKGEDLFLKAFQQLSNSISQEILRDERNLADNKSTEVWILLAPLAVIPGTLLIYLLLFQKYFDILSCYETLEAKTTAAITFLVSGVGAIFVNWVRRNR